MMKMRSGTTDRLVIALVGLLVFPACPSRKDAIADLVNLAPPEVDGIISNVEEWSPPKWSREIVLRNTSDRSGNVAAWVSEADDRWSVTVFTNVSGSWRKFGWALVERDAEVRRPLP
jgi:hypothetical protein